MSDYAIRVNGLGKRYRVGRRRPSLLSRLRLTPKPANVAAVPADDGRDSAEFWALKDICFDIKHGEAVGIIGRNGAGKSTLLKILSGITEPTKGRAEVNGRVGSLLEVGTGFHPDLTGRENIFLNGALLGMRRGEIQRKFDEIVAFSELEKFIDTAVKHYSSGMYMRLAFAIAAHLEPEILIVDEVLAVGDARFQKKCLGKMENIAKTGRTIFFVSHNLTAVATLCDRAIFLQEGRVVADSNRVADAVNRYMRYQPGDSAAGARWCGHIGNDEIVLTRFLAMSEAHSHDVFEVDQPYKVEIGVHLLREVTGLVVGVHVNSERGYELLFTAQHDQASAEASETFSTGDHTFTLSIPANIFAHGRYLLIPNIGIYNRYRLVGQEVGIFVEMRNISGLGRKYVAGAALEDILRPSWRWSHAVDNE